MARHADPNDHSFRRSLLRAAAGGLAALLVTFGITGVLSNFGRDRSGDSPAMVLTEPAPTAPQTSVSQPAPAPEITAAQSQLPKEPADEPTPVETTETPQDERVTVQVLDAAGSPATAEAAAAALRELGYEVVAVNETPRSADVTTVLFTDGHADDAKALRSADSRFVQIRKNADFNPSVDLHVLVGPDFTP